MDRKLDVQCTFFFNTFFFYFFYFCVSVCLYPLAPLQVVVGGPIVRFVTGPTTSKSGFDWKALLRHDVWLWLGRDTVYAVPF